MVLDVQNVPRWAYFALKTTILQTIMNSKYVPTDVCVMEENSFVAQYTRQFHVS